MINQQLLDYIKKQQEAGTADEIIKENLAQAGWRQEDIEEGFQAVSGAADDNSTESHQKIREEAAEQRSNKDEYQEEVGEEDASGPQAAEKPNKSPNLSPIDETASNSGDSGESAGDGGSQPKDVGDAGEEAQPTSEKTTSDSMSKLAKQDTSQVDPDEVGPVAVRTFHSDSQKAGVNTKNQQPKAEQQSQPDQQRNAEEGVETAAAAVAKKEKERQSREKKKQREEERQRRQREERAKEERERRKREEERKEQEETEKIQINQAQPQKPASAMASMETVDSVSEPQSRETDDGRRRFSAAGEPEQVARRVARKRRKGDTSKSSSNFVSILVFIIALVLVGGGAAWAYFTYFQTDIPETTAANVTESLAAAETFNFRTTVETAGAAGEPESQLVIEGAVDLNQETAASSYYIITQEGELATPIQAVMAETENITAVPQAQRETIRDILLTPEFFSIGEFQTQERLGQTQDSDGFVTNRFSISMNSGQFVSDYATLHQALFDSPLSGAVLDSLQASVGGFSPTQGQTWIDPDTGAPYQMTFIGTNADGQDVQINLQFKNHGAPLDSTPPYEPRSFEQTLGQYFTTVASPDEETAGTTPNSTSTQDTSSQSSANMTRRNDRLRINDIQQLVVALRIYANENNVFPASLVALTDSTNAILSEVPRDPTSDEVYVYSVADDGSRYHLGTTLELLTRSDLLDDANFNSRGQGFPGGFNGATSSCGDTATSTSASTCYDVAGSISN